MPNPTGMTTTTQVGPKYEYYAFSQLLPYGMPYTNTSVIAQVKSLPKNESTVAHFTRVERLETDPIQLTEGTTPDATQVTVTEVEATIKQYGRYIQLTDVVKDTSFEAVVNSFSSVLGDDLACTLEQLNAVELCSGTNAIFANGTQRNQVNTAITKEAIKQVVRLLEGNYAKKVTSINNAANLYNTSPIAPAYVAFCHSDLRGDIEALEGFVPVEKYASQKLIHPTEIGAIGQVRFLLNNFMTVAKDGGGEAADTISTSGTKADVYCVPVVAKDAFGVIDHTGYGNGKMYYVPVGEPSKGDPLAQRGSVGYKVWYAAKVLNDDFVVRIECAATA